MLNIVGKVQAQTLGEGLSKNSVLLKGGVMTSDGGINWDVLVSFITTVLFFVATVASLIYLIWGAYLIIISSGDQAKLSSGRYKMIYAAIGLILVGGAYAIWRTVLGVAGISTLESGF